MKDLDRAGFYAKTKELNKDDMHDKLMKLFSLIEFVNNDIHGDWNWELMKRSAGLPSDA